LTLSLAARSQNYCLSCAWECPAAQGRLTPPGPPRIQEHPREGRPARRCTKHGEPGPGRLSGSKNRCPALSCDVGNGQQGPSPSRPGRKRRVESQRRICGTMSRPRAPEDARMTLRPGSGSSLPPSVNRPARCGGRIRNLPASRFPAGRIATAVCEPLCGSTRSSLRRERPPTDAGVTVAGMP
jgi:hypothetical protein